jgi:hypothetical protein
MWLLDANMDVHLVDVLSDFGIPCETAPGVAGRRCQTAIS